MSSITKFIYSGGDSSGKKNSTMGGVVLTTGHWPLTREETRRERSYAPGCSFSWHHLLRRTLVHYNIAEPGSFFVALIQDQIDFSSLRNSFLIPSNRSYCRMNVSLRDKDFRAAYCTTLSMLAPVSSYLLARSGRSAVSSGLNLDGRDLFHSLRRSDAFGIGK